MRRAKRQVLATLRFVIAIVLVLLILRFIDWSQLGDALYHMQRWPLAAAIVAFIAISLLEGLRFHFVMPAGALSFGYAVKLQIMGSAFANVTPAQLGGDAYKAVRLGNEGHDLYGLSFRLVSLRIIGLLVVVVAGCVALVFDSSSVSVLAIGNITGIHWLFAFCLVLVPSIAIVLARAPLRGYWQRRPSVEARAIVAVVIITMAMLFLRVMVMLCICRSVGFETGLHTAMLVTTFSLLATWLPISIAGAGVREGVIVLLLTRWGASYDESFAVALIGRLLMVCQGLVGAIWWMTQRDRSKS